MTDPACRDFFAGLEGRFKAEMASSLEATFQFELLGDGGGQWFVEVKEGTCRVTEGRAESPNLTATTAVRDFVDMIDGRLNPQLALLSGKLSIHPKNLELAQAFGKIFF